MALNRRQLLQYTGASCALAALPPLTGAAAQLRAYQVQDRVAAPRFEIGDLVVADVDVGKFTGPGLYLYPAWGQPRLYDVQATGDRLHFRNPGSGQLLWTQSANLDSAFAGRVLDRLESATVLATLPDLAVPRLPFTA
jgi:hypothetical protein